MRFIIIWDAGYGEMADVIEANSQEEADDRAYAAWHDDVESNANYRAVPWNEEEAYGLDLLTDEELEEYEKELDNE